MTDDQALIAEVEQRLDRPWDQVRSQLEALFGQPWDECEVFIATSATKKDRSEADVIVDLIREKADIKTPPATVVRRKVIQWIGKPWREREDPWNRFRDRVPPSNPARRVTAEPDDLDEWKPYKPKEQN